MSIIAPIMIAIFIIMELLFSNFGKVSAKKGVIISLVVTYGIGGLLHFTSYRTIELSIEKQIMCAVGMVLIGLYLRSTFERMKRSENN